MGAQVETEAATPREGLAAQGALGDELAQGPVPLFGARPSIDPTRSLVRRLFPLQREFIDYKTSLTTCYASSMPQQALRGGIPSPFLEPLARCWSHLVGIYHQKLKKSS